MLWKGGATNQQRLSGFKRDLLSAWCFVILLVTFVLVVLIVISLHLNLLDLIVLCHKTATTDE